MHLTIEQQDNDLRAVITGDIDHHTAVMLREKVDRQILERKPKRLIIDLSGVEFMDSSGLGFIMGRYKVLSSVGGEVAVTGAKNRVSTIIKMSGALKFVKEI